MAMGARDVFFGREPREKGGDIAYQE